MRKKFLAGLLALVMLLSLVPVTAFAAEGETEGDSTLSNVDGLHTVKTVEVKDDGTFDINLEAWVTGSVTSSTTTTPTDVVLVLDVSGSMKDCIICEDAVGDGDSDTHPASYVATYNVQNNGTYYIQSGNNYQRVYRCSSCRAWFTEQHYTRHNSGNRVVPRTSADSTSGTVFYIQSAASCTSRMASLQDAVNYFIDQTAAKNAALSDGVDKHRIAIVKFADDTYGTGIGNDNTGFPFYYNKTQVVSDFVEVIEDTETQKNSEGQLKDLVNSLYAAGATSVDYGLNLAEDVLNGGQSSHSAGNLAGAEEDHAKVVIVFTDGEPNHSSRFSASVAATAVNKAKDIKDDDATIFTISVLPDSDPSDITTDMNKYMHGVSSNYPSATAKNINNQTSWDDLSLGTANEVQGHYKKASSREELIAIFEAISESVGSATIDLGSQTVLKDIVGTGFALPENFNSSDDAKIELFTATYTGNGTFADSVAAPETVTATVNGKTIDVTGFDYSENYVVDGSSDGQVKTGGKKLIVKITGLEIDPDMYQDGIVYTNGFDSGIYDGNGDLIENFPRPFVMLGKHSYVVDYAKSFDMHAEEFNQEDFDHLAIDPTGFETPNLSGLDLTNGKVVVKDKTTLNYIPQTTNWNGYDTFYVFGHTYVDVDAVNLWSQVNVIPANNVYYEDTFVSTEEGTAEADAVVGIAYGDNWKIVTDNEGTEGTEGTVTETPDGAVMGWEENLSDDTAYSDGAAHETGTAGATAAFTFTGTGVDIYSRTNMDSGIIVGILYKEGEDKPVYETDENGDVRYYYGGDGGHEVTKGEDGKWYYEKGGVKYEAPEAYVYPMVKSAAVAQQTLMVDNLAVSGDYYQVPTLSFQNLEYGSYVVRLGVRSAKAPLVDSDGSIVTEPVVMTNEDGTTYTVNRIVYDESGVLRSTYYLDGIRIYNPLGQTVSDDTVVDAYDPTADQIADSIQSVFTEVRNILDAADDRMVFIDMDDNGEIGATDYGPSEVNTTYGPKNEVYLNAGDSIVFAIDGYDANGLYYVGLKSLTGDTVKAAFTDDVSGVATDIAHTTDLYYKVTPARDGKVIVRNASESGILSVTKIQAVIPGAATFTLRTIASEEAETYAAAFMGFELGEYQQPVVEEPVEPEIPEEPTEPETPEVPDIDIEIENPEPKPEKTPVRPILHHNLKKLVNNLFNQIHGWFGR